MSTPRAFVLAVGGRDRDGKVIGSGCVVCAVCVDAGLDAASTVGGLDRDTVAADDCGAFRTSERVQSPTDLSTR
jgi:hypothetical protein